MILGSMFIVIVCFPGCDIDFEMNLHNQAVSVHNQKLKTQI